MARDSERYFGHGAPTGADAPENEFNGYPSRQALNDAYRRDMHDVATALEKPVQDKVAAADRHAHSRRGR